MQVESKVEGRDREEKDGKTLRTVLEITLSFMKKIQFDHVSSFAAHAALFLLMSLFPMAMFCISMFRYFPLDSIVIPTHILEVLPEGLTPLLEQILAEAYTESSTTMLQSFTMIGMLFCASKGVYAVIIGMNAVYGIRETRSTPILYALAIFYILTLFSIMGLMLVFIVLGNNLFQGLMYFIPSLSVFYRVFQYGKYICMLFLLILFFLLTYMHVPNRKSKMRYEFPGAVFSTAVWLLYSWAFSFYIDNFAQYSVTYGSLATIVIFILWLYGTMNIVFIGAEINVVLRKYAEYGYNHWHAYEYYKNKYQGDIIMKDSLIFRLKRKRRENK